MHVYGMSRGEAGAILNMIAVGLIVGSPLISLLSDRVLFSRKHVLSIFSGVMVALTAIFYLFPAGIPKAGLYLAIFIFSVSSSAIVVIGFTTTKEMFPIEIAGTSVGTVNLFPFLGGAVFQPLVGWILDSYPKSPAGAYTVEAYKTMFVLLLGASTIAFISTFFMKETFPAKTK